MKIHHTILIVEDNKLIPNSLQNIVKENNGNKFLFLSASSEQQVITFALHERPDLILLDIEMPSPMGIDTIKHIKSNHSLKNIPIIILSSTRQFQEAFDAGADDFLIKPFNKYELFIRIQLNLQLAEKRSELKKKHELVKTQKQEVIIQRDTIIMQQTELMNGLHYARYVQNATFPSTEILNNLFDSHFVLNKPKNIVSGDFYWVTRKKEFVYIAVGDCTGHGMSGALMSMAGAAFLNEIVLKNPYSSADEILNELRSRVIQLLNQKGDLGEAGNGMDIALCIYDESSKNLQYAGANNPIFLSSKNNPLEIIKGDRMPIGFYFNIEQSFTKIDRKVDKGDTLYLFTDGYSDQFGGPLGQKLRSNRFKDLIIQATELKTMGKQYEFLKKSMDEWINGYDQIDDILVMGIRI